MDVLIALDIGTTVTKAALVDRKGYIINSTQAGYPVFSDGPRVEQNPEDWWRAVCICLNKLIREDKALKPSAIILSGQMQDVILVGGKQNRAILYSDVRAQAEAMTVQERIGEERLQQTTGNLQDASSLLAKLLWLKANETTWYHQVSTLFIGAHDYIAWRLCGCEVADYTTASTTGLLNLSKNSWAEDIFSALDLRTDWLPKLEPTGKQVGKVTLDAAALTGLAVGLPVIHGAGDAAAATLGAGAGVPGQFYAYLGTSGWLATTVEGDAVDPLTGVFNLRHPDGKSLILIGPLLTAAGNFKWLNEQFGALELIGMKQDEIETHEAINQVAATAPPGSGGLIYLPFLAGERSPFRDPNARGVFIGLRNDTSRANLYRAVLEGVAFAMRSIRDVMVGKDGKISGGLNLVGGGARSALWAQIFADMFDCQVNVLADPENVGTRGALIMGGNSLGWYPGYLPDNGFFHVKSVFLPVAANVATYNWMYEIYRQGYPALKAIFAALASGDT